MTVNVELLKNIVEAAIMVADEPISADRLLSLFGEEERPTIKELRIIIEQVTKDYQNRGIELKEVASGYRFQVKDELASWISRLWEERTPRYSRALLETLALIAYRQPITRAEIEEVRGVVVSTQIMRTVMEREWVQIVGHKDVPGKPALYGTTKHFLDYFNLKSLAELPVLLEPQNLEKLDNELQVQLSMPVIEATNEHNAVPAETIEENS